MLFRFSSFRKEEKPCGQNYIELTLNKGNNLELTSCDSNICHHTVVTPCSNLALISPLSTKM